jgi:hypothetical protein
MHTRSPCSGVTCNLDKRTGCLEFQSGSPRSSVFRWWPGGENKLFKMRVLSEAKGTGRLIRPQHRGDRELWKDVTMTCNNPLCLNPEHMAVVLGSEQPVGEEDFDGNYLPSLCQGL